MITIQNQIVVKRFKWIGGIEEMVKVIKIKNTTKIITIAFFINLLMIFLWFFLSFIFGGYYDPWVFIDFVFPFIGLYFLVIFLFSFKFTNLKEKTIFCYLSSLVPLGVFTFIFISSIEKASITFFLIFLIGPLIISLVSFWVKHLLSKRLQR